VNCSARIDMMDDGHAQLFGWLKVGGDVINEHDAPRGTASSSAARRQMAGSGLRSPTWLEMTTASNR